MGTVFVASDEHGGPPVAIKVLHSTDPKIAERFVREAEILTQLDHPRIVRFVASGITAQHERWLAMQWLKGEDLGVRLRSGRAMEVHQSVTLARLVAQGLGHAHQMGVVHRDIKPGNLFLVDGDPLQPQILDFGVARLTQRDMQMTATGASLGTPAYMAPEQAGGTGHPDARADVFSLGAVLYECLAGQMAYPDDTLLDVLTKILFAEPPRLRDVRPDLPVALDEVVAKMMAKVPAQRYADGDDVARALLAVASVRGPRPMSAMHGPVMLTRAERRLGCVVVVSARRMMTSVATLSEAELAQEDKSVAVAARLSGFDVQSLADGSKVATLHMLGLPQEQVERTARFALHLSQHVCEAPVGVAVGWSVVGPHHAIDPVLARALLAVAECDVPGVWVDPESVPLLESEFLLEQDGPGWRLIGLRQAEQGARQVLGKPSPCVGRQQEFALIQATFAQCLEESEAAAVVVTAEPGLGKTRLAAEFVAKLGQSGDEATVLSGRGDVLAAGATWSLLGQAIRRWAGVSEGGDPVLQRQRLQAQLANAAPGPGLADLQGFLGEITGLQLADSSLALRAARADPVLMATQTGKAWLAFVRALASKGPVVLVLDDLQWGDLPSVRAVDATLQELRDLPILVLAMGRPEMHDKFANLWRARDAHDLRLRRLPAKACERMVQQVLGNQVDAEQLATLLQRAEGNPYFLEELMRHVARGDATAFPDSVLAMVQARLANLGQGERQVLRAASVFSQTFWLGGVLALVGGGDQVVQVHQALTALQSLELVELRPTAAMADQIEYAFCSAMVQEAAYALLTAEDLATGHRLAAKWLQAAGERNPLVLAEHCLRGGDGKAAAQWFLAAAGHAQDAQDSAATVARCTLGLQAGAVGEVRGRLRLLQADAFEWKGDFAASEVAAREAESLLETGAATWFSAAGSVLIASARFGATPDFEPLGDRIAQAVPLDDVAAGRQAVALCRGALNALWVGHNAAAGRWIGSAEHLARGLNGSDLLATARLHHARAYLSLNRGSLGLALDDFAAAAQAWLQAGDLRSSTGVSTNLGFTWSRVGDFARAEAMLREQLQQAERLGLGFLGPVIEHNLATALALSGEVASGLALKEAAVPRLGQSGHPRLDGNVQASLAELLLLGGRAEQALLAAQTAVGLLPPFPPTLAYALGVQAQALFELQRPAEALVAADRGMAILTELGGMEEGESQLRLVHAEALHACGQAEPAQAALLEAALRLEARARALPRPLRAPFLSGSPARRRTFELAEAWGLINPS